MEEAKNQHYIPQSYLRNFTIRKKGKNFYVFVRFKGERFYETNVRNICSENYFYSIPGVENIDKNSVEKYYADKIDSLYPEILKIVCDDNLTIISQDQREKIIRAVLNLYFRTPKFLKYYQNHIYKLEEIIDAYHLGKSENYIIDFFGYSIDLRTVNYSEFKLQIKDKGKQLFLSQHLKFFEEFVSYKKNDGIGISKIEDDSEYITSDNPVIIRNSRGKMRNIFSKGNVIYLPINNKYLITITPKSEDELKGTFSRISASFDDVVGINHDIEKNSEKWIIGSKDGMHNHLDKVELIEKDRRAGESYFNRNIKKAILMKELEKVLNRNGGTLTREVIVKIIAVSKEEVMKDDVNMKRYLVQLREKGFIK